MLGVRREGVTEASGKLGIIRYARGRIIILDRPKLKQPCCECYAVVKKESDRLLPMTAGEHHDCGCVYGAQKAHPARNIGSCCRVSIIERKSYRKLTVPCPSPALATDSVP